MRKRKENQLCSFGFGFGYCIRVSNHENEIEKSEYCKWSVNKAFNPKLHLRFMLSFLVFFIFFLLSSLS